MPDLTDTQLVLLSAAAQRDDHVIPIADRLKGAIAKTVAEKMIALGLAEERLVDLRTPAWRRDENGHSIALLISANGLAALGLGDDGQAAGPAIAGEYAPHRGEGDAEPSNETTPTFARKTIHGATKRAAVIDLLQRVGGASIDEIMLVTGWLAHTTRAALTGLRKKAFAIEKFKGEDGATRYRIDHSAMGSDQTSTSDARHEA